MATPKKISPVKYERLLDIDDFMVGFKRTIPDKKGMIVEYIDLEQEQWQLKEMPHASTIRLDVPPVGLGRLKRAKLPTN